ncbi:MAG: hypothetical protein FJ146_11225 [Deltaproteobacteria bacterium]|nr:hypothetical protein [Deltaproteobacteria bacterium]
MRCGKHKWSSLAIAFGLFVGAVLFGAPISVWAAPFALSYSGRLTAESGAPLAGPLDIKLRFWSAAVDGTQLGPTLEFLAVTLSQGVFTVAPSLSAADADAIFGDGTSSVYVEVSTADKTYPRQRYSYAPMALRVPVDDKTIGYDANGVLSLNVGSRPSAGHFLAVNGAGQLAWESPPLTNLAGQTLSTATPSSGQVMTFSGGEWRPLIPSLGNSSGTLTVGSGGTGVSSFTNNGVLIGAGSMPLSATAAGNQHQVLTVDGNGAPLFGAVQLGQAHAVTGLLPITRGGTGADLTSSGGNGQYLKQATLGGAVTVGALTATDINAALGYTPLSKAGDTVTGALHLSANDVKDAGNVTLAAAKTLGLGVFDANSEPTMIQLLDASGALSLDKGRVWFNKSTNQIKFWDGSTALSLGVSGAGVQSLNGQTGSGQSFAVVSTGTSPAITSNANVHTLNLPMATASGVTAGLLTNADYTALKAKPDAVSAGTGIAVANTSGTAMISLLPIGTGGTYTKVITNAQGQVSGATTLDPTDLPPMAATKITSGQLSVTQGGTGVSGFTNGGVVVGSSGMLSSTAAGSSGNVLIVGASGPEFSAVNLASTAAVSGVLGTAHGGTGVNGAAVFPSSGTVVTRDAAETLTGKTLTTAVINGSSTISGVTVIDTTGTVTSGALTVLGEARVHGDGTSANKLTFTDKGSVNSISLKAPDTLTASAVFTLPSADGGSGYVLNTDGSGNLGWTAGMPPVGAAIGDLTGSFPAPQLAASGVIAGTYTKVAVDAKGRAIFGDTLVASDLPPIPGTLVSVGAVAVAHGGTGASTANEGFNALSPMAANGDLIYGGTSGAATRLAGNTTTVKRFLSSTGSGAAANAPQWNTLASSDLPAHNASLITSGQLAISQGGTGLGTTPANGQVLIGNGAGYSLTTLTPGTGINVTNSSGTVTIAATADASTKVSLSGDTMTGPLTIPSNGLTVGNNQLALASGRVGVGVTLPARALDIESSDGYQVRIGNTQASQNYDVGRDASAGALSFYGNQTGSTGYSFGGVDGTRMVIDAAGNIGVGTSTPTAKLQVAGQIVSSQTVVASGATADFAAGNVQVLQSVGGTAITLNNMQDGGAYTLIVSDPTSRTYTFTNCTNPHWLYTNGPTTVNTRTIYTIIKTTESSATHCYISWITGL